MERSYQVDRLSIERPIQLDQGAITLMDIPSDVLILIFSFLNGYKYRYQLRLVCKQWIKYLNLWDFSIGYYLTSDLEKIVDTFSKCTNLLGLHFTKSSMDYISTTHIEPISKLTNLSSLTFSERPNYEQDPRFISALTNLQQLTIGLLSNYTIEPLTKLRHLKAQVNAIGTSSSFNGKYGYDLTLPNLESAYLTNVNVPPSFPKSPKLTRLVLKAFSTIPTENYFATSQNLKALELIASWGHNIHLGINLPNLEMLKIYDVHIENWSGLQKITSLCVTHSIPENNNMKDISLLTNLETLSYLGWPLKEELDLYPLSKLTSVDFRSYGDSANALPIFNVESIKSLQINCAVHQVSDVTKFGKLTDLQIQLKGSANNYVDLTPLSVLQYLKTLTCYSESSSAQAHIRLPVLEKLESLSISASNIEGLGSLTCLTSLGINSSVVNIHGLTNLQVLLLQNVESLSYNHNHAQLTHLTVEMCSKEITDQISTWTSLRSLTLQNVDAYEDFISHLTALNNLRTLLIYDGSDIVSWDHKFTVLSQLHHIEPRPPYKFEDVRNKMPFCVL